MLRKNPIRDDDACHINSGRRDAYQVNNERRSGDASLDAVGLFMNAAFFRSPSATRLTRGQPLGGAHLVVELVFPAPACGLRGLSPRSAQLRARFVVNLILTSGLTLLQALPGSFLMCGHQNRDHSLKRNAQANLDRVARQLSRGVILVKPQAKARRQIANVELPRRHHCWQHPACAVGRMVLDSLLASSSP